MTKQTYKTKQPPGADANLKLQPNSQKAYRETVESIVVAIILAFLFRAFVAEAFVIPTGSMAPTLQGNHKDVTCSQCGHDYRAGASIENDGPLIVKATTCPICRYVMEIDESRDANQATFTGDRILVSKFAYDLREPKRWDVFVFKFPGNAKQNYIKRLVGLPNEIVRIRHGDIFLKDDALDEFRIARKPPAKLTAMLQLVDDSAYVPQALIDAGWPQRWHGTDGWGTNDSGRTYQIDGNTQRDAWLHYRHFVPTENDWANALEGRSIVLDGYQGQLITDYYAYNDFLTQQDRYRSRLRYTAENWVGDLAVQAEIEVQSATGSLLLVLVEGGLHYQCSIDVATGLATLSIDDGQGVFTAADGATTETVTGKTSVMGKGRHTVQFSNVDDELLLWVDGSVVTFTGPKTYVPVANVKPQWSPQDPGDLSPARIGSRQLAVNVERLQLLRDIYYVATTSDSNEIPGRYDVDAIFQSPETWDRTGLFADRASIEFTLTDDQFLPLGDNSPQSKDARLWFPAPPYVKRELLTGKALFIYWPHSWNRPVPFTPNIKRMGFIR